MKFHKRYFALYNLQYQMKWNILWIFLIFISQIFRNHFSDDYLFSIVNKQTVILDQLFNYFEKEKETCLTYSNIVKVVQFLIKQWDSNDFNLNWYVSIVKKNYLNARWHKHNNFFFGRFNAVVSQFVDLLFARNFKILILFSIAIAYTSSMITALKQRDSYFFFSFSFFYFSVLKRSNHKMRKQNNQYNRCF